MYQQIRMSALFALLLYCASGALANGAEGLRQELDAAKESLESLKARLEKIDADQTHSATDRVQRGLQLLNPEIGVVADIVYINTESDEDAEGNDKISVRELELIIGADIDPYSRFDSTLTFSDFEDFVVEEAYISHYGLPFGIKGRLGRLRPMAGKANPLHLDQQDSSDYPLPIQEYLGVDGWFRSGLELSYLFNLLPRAWTHELLGGILEGGVGEGGTMFGDIHKTPTANVRLKNFWDASDNTSMEFGVNWLQGSSRETENFDVTALVGDVTLIHRIDATRRIKLQSELWWQDRDQPSTNEDEHHEAEEGGEELDDDGPIIFRENPIGLYVLGDYRLSGRWGLGARYDHVEPINIEGKGGEDAASTAYLAFYQSEYFRWRLQYQHIDLAGGGDDNRFWIQATIGIGVHKHAIH